MLYSFFWAHHFVLSLLMTGRLMNPKLTPNGVCVCVCRTPDVFTAPDGRQARPDHHSSLYVSEWLRRGRGRERAVLFVGGQSAQSSPAAASWQAVAATAARQQQQQQQFPAASSTTAARARIPATVRLSTGPCPPVQPDVVQYVQQQPRAAFRLSESTADGQLARRIDAHVQQQQRPRLGNYLYGIGTGIDSPGHVAHL